MSTVKNKTPSENDKMWTFQLSWTSFKNSYTHPTNKKL